MDRETEKLKAEIQRLHIHIATLESQLGAGLDDDGSQNRTLNAKDDLNGEKPRSDEHYRILVENANDAVIVAQDYRFAFYNQRTAELTGYTYDELAQLPFLQLIYPEDRGLVGKRYMQRLKGDDVPDVYTFRALKKSGDYFWVEIRAVRIDWQDRPAILCYLTDISERKSTELNLVESEQRYRNIVELSPYGIITLDAKGVIVTCNSAFIDLTGFSYSDFIGRHFTRIPTIRIRDVPQFIRIFGRILIDGFDKPIVFAWTHRDGTERWGEARCVLLRHEDKVQGLQGIIRDITENRRATQLLDSFNRTALAVERTTKPQEVFSVMGNELNELGISCAVFMLHDDGRCLLPVYLSYEARAIKMVEKLIHQQTGDFQIDIDKVDLFKRVIQQRATLLNRDPVQTIEAWLPESLRDVAGQIVKLLEIKTSINTPLIIEDQVIGVVSVQSDVFQEVDIPNITAIANLMAAALHKAQLLEHAERELEERRKAEGEISRLQRLLQNITSSMPSALVTLDLLGRVLALNPAAEKLLGQWIDVQPGLTLDMIDPNHIYQELFDSVLSTHEIVTRHQHAIKAGERTMYQNIDAFPLVADTVDGVVFRIDDVTDFVQIQELMLQTAKLASVGGLAAGVAHEINNPLAAMIQSAQMIQQSLDVRNPKTLHRLDLVGIDPERLRKYIHDRRLIEYVEGIREAGGRAAKIVADLLAFSRKSPSMMIPTDINHIIESALDLAVTDYNLSKHFDFKDIEIIRDFDTNLPKVVCDQQQIQQVILNLVRNAAQTLAAKYDIQPAFIPRITVRTHAVDGMVRITLDDNGLGIDENSMNHIFEPFYTTKEVGEGTGLGLWLSWSIIVERHKGRIWPEAMPGEGVRFTVELPLGKTDG